MLHRVAQLLLLPSRVSGVLINCWDSCQLNWDVKGNFSDNGGPSFPLIHTLLTAVPSLWPSLKTVQEPWLPLAPLRPPHFLSISQLLQLLFQIVFKLHFLFWDSLLNNFQYILQVSYKKLFVFILCSTGYLFIYSVIQFLCPISFPFLDYIFILSNIFRKLRGWRNF